MWYIELITNLSVPHVVYWTYYKLACATCGILNLLQTCLCNSILNLLQTCLCHMWYIELITNLSVPHVVLWTYYKLVCATCGILNLLQTCLCHSILNLLQTCLCHMWYIELITNLPVPQYIKLITNLSVPHVVLWTYYKLACATCGIMNLLQTCLCHSILNLLQTCLCHMWYIKLITNLSVPHVVYWTYYKLACATVY